MSISDKKLSLDGNAELLDKLTADFYTLVKREAKEVPPKRIYQINCEDEPNAVKRLARYAFFNNLNKPIKKLAFDTRHVDQENTRNPRRGLQYYHRSDQFIGEEMQEKLNVFSKLMVVLEDIKSYYGKENAYHDSYARELYGHLERALRLKVADGDHHEPQLAYLEQLIFARYRLSMDEINKADHITLKKAILNKDEDLIRRGTYLGQTGGLEKSSTGPIVIDGNRGNAQQNIIEAIFGNNDFRRDGERKVERTITITISDEVKD